MPEGRGRARGGARESGVRWQGGEGTPCATRRFVMHRGHQPELTRCAPRAAKPLPSSGVSQSPRTCGRVQWMAVGEQVCGGLMDTPRTSWHWWGCHKPQATSHLVGALARQAVRWRDAGDGLGAGGGLRVGREAGRKLRRAQPAGGQPYANIQPCCASAAKAPGSSPAGRSAPAPLLLCAPPTALAAEREGQDAKLEAARRALKQTGAPAVLHLCRICNPPPPTHRWARRQW